MNPMHLLPSAFLWLVLTALSAVGQTRLELPLNAVSQFSGGTGPFAIPPAPQIAISVASCSQNSALRFMLSLSASAGIDFSTVEIPLVDGQGAMVGDFPEGGTVTVEGTGTYEIALSTSQQPFHEILPNLPLFGDSTSNQAILFSPPFFQPSQQQPTYPNYTMNPVDVPQPDRPTTTPNYTLALIATTQNPYPRTGCFLARESQLQSSNINVNASLWLKDEQGWRSQFLVGGLTPSTNYTAYLLQDNTKVFGPIYFGTKSPAFPCPLVSNVAFCPGVAYAMPLDPPPNNAEIYTGDTLPTTLTDPLKSYMTNFTVTLNSFACGRDMYSPLMTCADCQREYRKWLCAVSLPRCSEPSLSNPDGFTRFPPAPTATGLSAMKNEQQQVMSALLPVQSQTPSRNAFLPPFQDPYQVLLPCIETCNAMDRACPAFLGIKCPTAQFNGAASYGIGYIDGKDGDQGEGLTGTAHDRYGNVWCHLG